MGLAEEHGNRAKELENNMRSIVPLTTAIDRVANEQTARREQAERHEQKKKNREVATIVGIAAGALIALIALIVTHRDTLKAIREAYRSADTQIAALNGQLQIMRGQLEEMQTEAAIRRSELAAIMRQTFDRSQRPDQWSITTIWTNIGKTNALHVKGWEDFRIFRTDEDYNALHPGFIEKTPSDKNKFWARDETIIPNDPRTSPSKYIPAHDAWDIAYGKGTFALAWGYVEYSDIFNELYTIRYCVWFNFTIVSQQLMIDLPAAYAEECNRRTQEHHKEGG